MEGLYKNSLLIYNEEKAIDSPEDYIICDTVSPSLSNIPDLSRNMLCVYGKEDECGGSPNGRDQCSTCSTIRHQNAPALLEKQYAQYSPWSENRGRFRVEQPPRFELGVSYKGATFRKRAICSDTTTRDVKMYKRRHRDLSSSYPYIGGIFSPKVRSVRPLWGQLCPMYQQLYPPPYGGILSTIQQGNGSMSFSLQSLPFANLSENSQMSISTIEIMVKNLVGDKKNIIGFPYSSLSKIVHAVKISNDIKREFKKDWVNIIDDQVYLIIDGQKYKYDENKQWKDINIKNGDIVHLMRILTEEERYQYIEELNKKDMFTQTENIKIDYYFFVIVLFFLFLIYMVYRYG